MEQLPWGQWFTGTTVLQGTVEYIMISIKVALCMKTLKLLPPWLQTLFSEYHKKHSLSAVQTYK
jgi:hypothetical protein